MVASRFAPLLERHRPAFGAVIQYNLAHVVMLAEREIVAPTVAGKLLRALRGLGARGHTGLRLDPELEDVYPNVEAAVIRELGEDVGGWLLTGRSRAEVQLTADRLLTREAALDLAHDLLAYGRALLDLADRHRETWMPTYTFLQVAQPSTFGHYLLGYVEVLKHDSQRLEAAYQRLNQSPAEIGICTGTGFPVDRHRVAELLGFAGVLENTLYALNSGDLDIELAAVLALIATHLSRLADDFYVWCSREFGFLELADEYCGTSFIMPQKKNPYVLDHPKWAAISSLSDLNQALNSYRTTPAQSPNDVFFIATTVYERIADVRAALRLLAGALTTLQVKREVMAARAAAGFTQASELADTLVRRGGLSFRSAHRCVGALVREAIESGRRAEEMTPDLVARVCVQVVGRQVRLSAADLRQALDVRRIVERRRVFGGPARQPMTRAIERSRAFLQAAQTRWLQRRRRLARAERSLEAAVERVAAGGRTAAPTRARRVARPQTQ